MNTRRGFLKFSGAGLLALSLLLIVGTRGVLAQSIAEINQLLSESESLWNDNIRNKYLLFAKKKVLAVSAAENIEIDADTIAWIDADVERQQAVYGSVYPADYRILKNINDLKKDLEPHMFDKYENLCLAAAVTRRTFLSGVGQPAYYPQWTQFRDLFRNPYEAERSKALDLDGGQKKMHSKKLTVVSHPGKIIPLAQADLSACKTNTLAREAPVLRDYLIKNNLDLKTAFNSEEHSNAILDIMKKDVGNKYNKYLQPAVHNLLVATGRMSDEPNLCPTVADFIRYLDRILSTPKESMNLEEDQEWPLFPVQTAPWPVLMPLSKTWATNEAQYVFEKYQGKHGGKRFQHYGPRQLLLDCVRGALEIDDPQWDWNSHPARMKIGGICGTMATIAQGTYTSLGIPSVKAGQRVHACIIRFATVGNKFYAKIEQGTSKNPDGTWTSNLFADDNLIRSRGRNETFADYTMGVVQSANYGTRSYLDTRIALHIYRRAIPENKSKALDLLLSALKKNPVNTEAWYDAAYHSKTYDDFQKIITAFDAYLPYKKIEDLEKEKERSPDEDLSDQEEKSHKETPLAVERNLAVLRSIIARTILNINTLNVSDWDESGQDNYTRRVELEASHGTSKLDYALDACSIIKKGIKSIQEEIEAHAHELAALGKKKKTKSTDLAKATKGFDERVNLIAAYLPRDERLAWTAKIKAIISSMRGPHIQPKRYKDRIIKSLEVTLENVKEKKPAIFCLNRLMTKKGTYRPTHIEAIPESGPAPASPE